MSSGLQRLRDIWEAMSRPNQVVLVAIAASVLIAGVGFVYWAGTPDFATLVTNPSPADSAGIINQLKTQKAPYRVVGDSIQVPEAMLPELKMTLTAQGLLNSGTLGYGALDKAPFGQTQAMEQQTIKRALEGEMEKCIQSLAPVATASVKFAAGDDSMFVSQDRKEPSASIVVHLKPGQELSKQNRSAIVKLVAHSYTGLSEKSITLLDGEGNLLWDGSQEGGPTVGIDERQSQERAYKEGLSREIQSELKSVLGANRSAVIVRAELDFDKKTEMRSEVLPGTVTQQMTEDETLKGAGQVNGPRTSPGVVANAAGAGGPATPPTYGSTINSAGGNYSRTTSTRTTAVGTSKTETVKAPGEVKSLSVSVLLDKQVPPETVAAIENTVKSIVGVDPANPAARQVSVQQVAFDTKAFEADRKAAEASAAAERTGRWLGYGVPLALMLVMLFILARGLKRIVPHQPLALPGMSQPLSLAAASAGDAGQGGLNLTVGDVQPGVAVVRDGDSIQETILGIGQGEQVHTFEVINPTFDADLQSIVHLAKSKPETVAALLKSWMTEKSR